MLRLNLLLWLSSIFGRLDRGRCGSARIRGVAKLDFQIRLSFFYVVGVVMDVILGVGELMA